jgi:predicted dehydrogenase
LQNAFGVGDADDHVRVTLRSLSTAITLVIEMFSTQAYSTERWMICGTAGGLRGDTNTIDWKWLRWEDGVQRVPSHEPFADRLYCQEELAWNSDTFTATDKFGDWQYSFYDDLYRSIRCGTEPFVSFESARSVAAILERVRTASREQDLQS